MLLRATRHAGFTQRFTRPYALFSILILFWPKLYATLATHGNKIAQNRYVRDIEFRSLRSQTVCFAKAIPNCSTQAEIGSAKKNSPENPLDPTNLNCNLNADSKLQSKPGATLLDPTSEIPKPENSQSPLDQRLNSIKADSFAKLGRP